MAEPTRLGLFMLRAEFFAQFGQFRPVGLVA
jgi:hypothetical protein